MRKSFFYFSQGMDYMINKHGIIHRDLKGKNIFLDTIGERMIVKIGDFGIALNKISNFFPDYCDMGTLPWKVRINSNDVQTFIFKNTEINIHIFK